ncbi:hormogonium polysaccharide biosynthesis glycosyltransferase HpsE [Calothrix sp. 336/3]|uniref:hormogonium polysaccharide biosynthesis glycosyltransferase HpsE n=1 Tax=Calothrix sp. 336/3 TaxID=1337936 RepID=UPI0004E2AF9B|nr:hormogonium polysaccharide biosynthesis glycosyltransferase HpsE [Calothrix sp. 336/3]AKG23336.1 glycosyl transferase [Calothrix sp. 336/3]
MKDILDLTVAIPTYNGATRLPELLERLKYQTDTESIQWEIIVVDNNSTDNTALLIKNYQDSWLFPYSLKYIFEGRQGAAFARQRAVEESRGKLIAFLDDDNYPVSNWVSAAYLFAQKNPKAGAYGSQVHGEYEVTPPENFEKIACFLAINERGSQAYKYEPRTKMLPPGAGLVVRKQAWCENVPPELVLNHKGREALLASEDLEAILHIQLGGWEIWYNPEMHIYHQIPAWRFEKEYLLSLIRCVGLSRHHLRMLRTKSCLRFFASCGYFFNDLRKLILHLTKYKKNSSNLIFDCEKELLISSIISPFYLKAKA